MAESSDSKTQGRRRLLKALVATGGAAAGATALPSRWTRPFIDSLSIPAHAQASSLPLVTGPFSTSQTSTRSIFDLFEQPVSASPIGDIQVGNGVFSLAWNLDQLGYTICGEGSVNTGNGVVAVSVNGSGGRAGNELNPYSQVITGGTLELTNQMASTVALSFQASFQTATTPALAAPGLGCSVSQDLRMSSPYPEGDRS
jgi:hypothetical protein